MIADDIQRLHDLFNNGNNWTQHQMHDTERGAWCLRGGIEGVGVDDQEGLERLLLSAANEMYPYPGQRDRVGQCMLAERGLPINGWTGLDEFNDHPYRNWRECETVLKVASVVWWLSITRVPVMA